MGLFKSSGHEKKHPSSQPPAYSGYEPPAGPPPGHYSNHSQDEKPPPGPPPGYSEPGQPSQAGGSSGAQQPYHDWTSVPDTSLLPPPPQMANMVSPTGNADEDEAIRAHNFCDHYPLIPPSRPTQTQVMAVRDGAIVLQAPREYSGRLNTNGHGVWVGSTRAGARDCSLLSTMPLYFAEVDNPLRTGHDKTIYFEVKINSLGPVNRTGESSIAIGYSAVPYPTWRMPGWERGSLAIHSDDGRRYVSDTDGGIDFTSPFRAGETVGIGMRFSTFQGKGKASVAASKRAPEGEVFFTRNGQGAGGWDVHEEMDSETPFGTLGVDGAFDLFATIGVFGGVSFEAVFSPKRWLFRP